MRSLALTHSRTHSVVPGKGFVSRLLFVPFAGHLWMIKDTCDQAELIHRTFRAEEIGSRPVFYPEENLQLGFKLYGETLASRLSPRVRAEQHVFSSSSRTTMASHLERVSSPTKAQGTRL